MPFLPFPKRPENPDFFTPGFTSYGLRYPRRLPPLYAPVKKIIAFIFKYAMFTI